MSDPRAIADALYETPLPPAELEHRLSRALEALSGPEGDELRAMIRWFTTRYPQPLERLAYARRKFLEAERTRGVAGARSPR